MNPDFKDEHLLQEILEDAEWSEWREATRARALAALRRRRHRRVVAWSTLPIAAALVFATLALWDDSAPVLPVVPVVSVEKPAVPMSTPVIRSFTVEDWEAVLDDGRYLLAEVDGELQLFSRDSN